MKATQIIFVKYIYKKEFFVYIKQSIWKDVVSMSLINKILLTTAFNNN